MMQKWQTVEGIIKRGHQVASGMARDSPYLQGTIEMQTPFFQKLGLDLSAFFPGTLNISISPKTFTLQQPEYICEVPQPASLRLGLPNLNSTQGRSYSSSELPTSSADASTIPR